MISDGDESINIVRCCYQTMPLGRRYRYETCCFGRAISGRIRVAGSSKLCPGGIGRGRQLFWWPRRAPVDTSGHALWRASDG
jgi:hypothetical protein